MRLVQGSHGCTGLPWEESTSPHKQPAAPAMPRALHSLDDPPWEEAVAGDWEKEKGEREELGDVPLP